jgi:hypothetical protein
VIFIRFCGPQALKDMDEFPIDGVFAHHNAQISPKRASGK